MDSLDRKVMELGNIKREIAKLSIQAQELEQDISQEVSTGEQKSKTFSCSNGLKYTIKHSIRKVFNADKWDEIKDSISKEDYPYKEVVDLTKASKMGLVDEIYGATKVEVKV